MTNRQRIHALLRELGYTKANLHPGVYRDATGSTWERDDSYIDECDGGDADDALLKRIVESHPAEAAKLILSQWGDGLPEPESFIYNYSFGLLQDRGTPEHCGTDAKRYMVVKGMHAVLETNDRPEAVAKVRELLEEK